MKVGVFMALLAFTGLVRARGAEDGRPPLGKLKAAEQSEVMAHDLAAWQRFRDGLARNRLFVHRRPDLFPPFKLDAERLLDAGQKEEIRALWSSLLDYHLALDSLGAYHSDYRKVDDRHRRHASFLIAYGCFLAQYRDALAFIAAADHDPAMDKILNEEMPHLGLPRGTYAQFRFRFLNLARATEFTALEVVYQARMKDPDEYAACQAALREDAEAIWRQTAKGSAMTFENAGRIVKQAGFTAYLPIQSGVADWMGATKVYRKHEYLISPEQIEAMAPRLRPGDILLTRREWHLSNIGLPGFWTHTMLYVGTPDERRQFLGEDPAVREFVRAQGVETGDFEALLARDYPLAYAAASASDERGHPPRILEAIAPGVVFRSLADGANCDSLAALRPRRTAAAIAVALHRACQYSGRPYDYNFDFQTDAAVVCSELVYKAYEPFAGYPGIVFPMSKLAGRFVLPPNEIARMFAETGQTDSSELDFVLFFDGDEQRRRTCESTREAFLESWRRPKWRGLAKNIAAALQNGRE